MKILTLNTHSLQEEYYEEKLDAFVRFVIHEKPDLIALQEVNQSISAMEVGDARCIGLASIPENNVPLKLDNHALNIVRKLRFANIPCSWAWLPIKIGYKKYDEGVSILSLSGQITATDTCAISRTRDYRNWRARKALGVQIEKRREWFYTVHMGWWQDENEPFRYQWEMLSRHLEPVRLMNRVWLLGDFNAPAELRGQSYDLIASSGWMDSFHLADQKDEGITVSGVIDGWHELIGHTENAKGMRIDHIWCSSNVPVKSSRAVFNGINEPVVSDHFGILIEAEGAI